MNEPAGPHAETGDARKPTEHDLVMEKWVLRAYSAACLIGVAVCLWIAFDVVQRVPLDTRLPYTGRLSRNGLPLPVSLGMTPLALALLARPYKGKKGYAFKTRRTRIIFSAVVPVIIVVLVWFHWRFGQALLIEGGAISGSG